MKTKTAPEGAVFTEDKGTLSTKQASGARVAGASSYLINSSYFPATTSLKPSQP